MDQITAEERALIDRALAEIPEEVRRIPAGATAFPAQYKWNGRDLVQVGGVDHSWRGADRICLGSGPRPSRRSPPRQDLETLRLEAAVAESIREGATITEMERKHPCGSDRIRRIARDHGLTIQRGWSKGEAADAKSAELDARAVELADGTRTVAEIAKAMGVRHCIVRRRVKRLGLNVRKHGEAA